MQTEDSQVRWLEYPAFHVGMELRFTNDPAESDLPWTVRAISRSGRFVCCTRRLPSQQTVEYTVLDLQQGIRGPDNYHGLGYETDEDCREALACFEANVVYDALEATGKVPHEHFADDADWAPAEYRDVLIDADGFARSHATISRRNNVPIRIVENCATP